MAEGIRGNVPFEETDDQLNAISEVKKDMESTKIMDRLICGDVGFGKTEVAIRAAFKAVQDDKQVAYLVPTTVFGPAALQNFLSRDLRISLSEWKCFQDLEQNQILIKQ